MLLFLAFIMSFLLENSNHLYLTCSLVFPYFSQKFVRPYWKLLEYVSPILHF
jgi:hypothetical protein